MPASNSELNKFDSGPNAIQAFASGTIDILVIGVAPVAVARSRGLDTSVIAAAAVGGTAFMAGPSLAKAFAENTNDPAKAFAAFRALPRAARPSWVRLPPGGVPTVALHHWLWKIGKVERSDVEITNMGIEVVQQAMLTNAIDGGTLLEPSATLVSERDPRIKRIVNSPDMFPNIPGVVVAASGALHEEPAGGGGTLRRAVPQGNRTDRVRSRRRSRRSCWPGSAATWSPKRRSRRHSFRQL
jgi:NitT/TauT family transport system substrate-binding protein